MSLTIPNAFATRTSSILLSELDENFNSVSTKVNSMLEGTTYYKNVTPIANNAHDLGTASLRWRNIYTNDLQLSNGIGDYTIVEGEEDLFLYNNKNGKTYKFVIQEVDPSVVPAKAKNGN